MASTYPYGDAAPTHAHAFLWPAVKRVINSRPWSDRHAFDLGCGNGVTGHMLSEIGFDVTGIDSSESGIAWANKAYPQIHAFVDNAYGDLAAKYGQYPLVISLEVIEHCMEPRRFLRTFVSLIASGGIGILSTPYHGYMKNLALALSGQMDRHFTALWDGGHVKFFSIATLRQLFAEQGVTDFEALRIGRIPSLARSMVWVVERHDDRPPP